MDARLLQASVWILFFTAVHKAMPTCMAKNTCDIWQSKETKISARWGSIPLRTCIGPPIAGSTPAVCNYSISPVGLVTAGNGKDESVRKHTGIFLRNCSVSTAECIFSCGSNALPALPENRYRGWNIRVKRISFHLNVRPLKYSAVGFAWAIGIVFY